jgi:hypothetical protein
VTDRFESSQPPGSYEDPQEAAVPLAALGQEIAPLTRKAENLFSCDVAPMFALWRISDEIWAL